MLVGMLFKVYSLNTNVCPIYYRIIELLIYLYSLEQGSLINIFGVPNWEF